MSTHVLCILALLSIFLPSCSRKGPELSSDESASQGRVGFLEEPRVMELRQPAPTARKEATEIWLDLLAQRPKATRYFDDRLIIDLGDRSSRPHLELGTAGHWSLGYRDQETGVFCAQLDGRSGMLDLPLDGRLAPLLHPADADGRPGLAFALTLRATVPKQRATVFWNERPLANLDLSQEWSRRTLSIPQDLALSGENRLRIHVAKTAQVEKRSVGVCIAGVEVGSRESIVAGPVDWGYARPRWESGTEPGLSLGAGTSVAFYLPIPRRARLRVRARGPGRLILSTSGDEDHALGRLPTILTEQELEGLAWRDLDLDLSGLAGAPIRLELRVEGDAQRRVLISRLDVLSPRVVPQPKRSPELRDVYVLTIEGARADEVYEETSRNIELPNLTALARNSWVFRRAFAESSAAVPSHGTWVASTHPLGHWTPRGTFVAGSRDLLPEVLARAGYSSAIVTANGDVGEERGLAQGAGRLINLSARDRDGRRASVAVREALELSDSLPGHRLVWINVNDPQAPYDPPQDLADRLGSALSRLAEAVPTRLWVERVRAGKVKPSPAQLGYVRMLYRLELLEVDRALGLLIDGLQARGRYDQSIIVVAGVHGEEFLEHQSAGHGNSLHTELLHVPLLISAPGLIAGTEVTAPVSLVDVAPTILDLLRLEPPPQWQGASLLPRVADPQPPPAWQVAQMGEVSRAALVDHYRLLLLRNVLPPAQLFYDLSQDPLEAEDVGRKRGVALRMVRACMAWFLSEEEGWKRARCGTPSVLDPDFARDAAL